MNIQNSFSMKEKRPKYNRTGKPGIAEKSVSRIMETLRKLVIPTTYGFDYVAVDRIIYCEADASYTRFHLEGGSQVVASKNIGRYEVLLAPYCEFFRVHKSYIINLLHVSKYKKETGGIVVMDNGKEIYISKGRKAGFFSLFFSR